MAFDQPLYLDACATTPLVREARAAMEQAQDEAWGNPSSLHGFGLTACESLERSRQQLADLLGAEADAVHFCSGATESVHLALQGVAAAEQQPGRLLVSAVEHPAVNAAAAQLQRGGWDVVSLPVDHNGQVLLEPLRSLLAPPTRLVSVIAAQSEVGSVQPIEAIGRLCRDAGVLFHTDAVQLVPHQRLHFSTAPIDLLTCTAHKLGGPRGIAALLVQPACRQRLAALLGGGLQERGLRAGTEPVVLAAGFAAALQQRCQWLASGEAPQLLELRNRLLERLLALPGVRLSGPDPTRLPRLPHHISLITETADHRPIPGRQLVRALWSLGLAASSGSACSSGSHAAETSPVLLALGLPPAQAAAGLRLSLLPGSDDALLERVPAALGQAMAACI